jgi:hypothetical protein
MRNLADPNVAEFVYYRALREWCLTEGEDHKFLVLFGAKGPFKRIEKNLEGHDLVNSEVVSIKVEASTSNLATEITVQYRTDDTHISTNPVVMVYPDGKVIRTHGDFYRLRGWVEEGM